MKLFIGANWYFMAAAGLLMTAFVRALKSSAALPYALKALRFSAAALAALVLLRPYAVFYRPSTEKPVLAVLLDASLYMKEGPAAKNSGASKYARASAWLEKYHPQLSGAAVPECYAFATRLYKVDCSSPSAAGSGNGAYAESDLGSALSSLAVGDGGRGAACPDRIWALTDGLSLSGKAPLSPSPGCEKRVDILAVGETGSQRGVAVTDFSGPPFAFAHIPFFFSASARVSGMQGARLELRLKDGAGNTLETRKFTVTGQDEVVVSSFSASAPSVGRTAYTLCAASGPGSACLASKALSVSVIREKLRVMYLAGRPSFEYSFLRDYLKSQSGIDLVSFVILRNPEDMPGVDERELSLIPFPVQEIFLRDISHFDVFILQDFDLRRFAPDGNYAASLAEFVKRGGGLAVIGGPSAFGAGGYSSMEFLNSLLPAEVEKRPDFDVGLEFRVAPAEHTAARIFSGMENEERFWAGAPPLKGANILGPLKPGAKAVFSYKDAAGVENVFSAEKSYGKGRVMAIAGPSTWRWKLMGARELKYSGLYPAFWSRSLAYLDGSLSLEKVALEPLPRSGASRAFRLKVLNANYLPPSDSDAVSVDSTLEGGGKTEPVEFLPSGRGIYEAAFLPAAKGRNRLRVSVKSANGYLGAAEASFDAGSAPGFTPSDEEALKKTAAQLGGGYYRLNLNEGPPAALLKSLPPNREGRAEASRFDPDNSLSVMLLAAALFLSSWILGRFKGLQ